MNFRFRNVSYPKTVRVPDQQTALKYLKPGVIVLVMPGQRPKSIKLLCPCGCREIISINLMPQAGQAWRVEYEPTRGLSLWPSVWLDAGCKSHFILRWNNAKLLSYKRVRKKGARTYSPAT